jgi:pyrroline-5-carboxylate reductase
MAEGKKIGFIGAGQMAEALARGFVNAGIAQAGDIRATDPMEVRKEVFRSFGAVAVDSNAEVSLLVN